MFLLSGAGKVSSSFQAIEERDPSSFWPQHWAFMSYPCLLHLSFPTWLLLPIPFPCLLPFLLTQTFGIRTVFSATANPPLLLHPLLADTWLPQFLHLTALVPKHTPLPSVSFYSHPKLFLTQMVFIWIWHQPPLTISSWLLCLVSPLSLNCCTQFYLLPLKRLPDSFSSSGHRFRPFPPSLHPASLSLSTPLLLTKSSLLLPVLETAFLSTESEWSLKAQKKQALGLLGLAAPGPGQVEVDLMGKIGLLSCGYMWEQAHTVSGVGTCTF